MGINSNVQRRAKRGNMGCATFIVIGIAVTLIFTFIFMKINKTGQSQESIIFTSMVFGFTVAFIVFCFKVARGLINPKKKKDIAVKKVGAKAFMAGTVISGLPGAENKRFEVYYYDTKIMIDNGVNTFNLDLDKVRNISIIDDVQVYKYLDHRDEILGRPRLKSVKEVNKYLAITYESDGGKKEIVINATYDLKKAGEFEELFRPSRNETEENATVDL